MKKILLSTVVLAFLMCGYITKTMAMKTVITAKTEIVAGDDWDKILDDYEKYVDQYIKTYKKAMNGDMDAMNEYVKLAEQAQKLADKLEKAKNELTEAQLIRLSKIAQKLNEALLNQ